ncbi:alcohol dehydrogenase catalytic domain-containing protein [Streptomyces sp. NPDC050287]|uniref:alcohol dehydrogenase catalytic domain-containing protein n=1 Tax=Streptomyces sp. NPDC050287 TaxID=3365608 RepID=UPI0037A1EDA1
MKAAVVRAFGAPLVIEERPDPEPGPGQVRVRAEASGLCHTDIHAAHGDWPVTPNPPFVPGPSGVGLVGKLGDGVTHLAVGQRVTVPSLGKACGRCEHCLSGWETLCEQQVNRADLVIDARKDDVGQSLKRYGGAPAALAPAVDEAAFAAVNSGLRRGGRLVMVAMPALGTIRVPIFDTVLNGTSVIGSVVGTRQDLAEVFHLHAAGRTRVIRETRPLASVNESIGEVLRGEVKARIVFDLDAGG